MSSYASRAGRRPLALTLSALTALAACSDDPAATAPGNHPRPSLAVGDVITVTNTKGGTDVGSLRWAVAQTTGGEIIRFDPRMAGATITLDSTLVIRNYLTIEGPADKGITISGGGRGRVIDVLATNYTDPDTKLRNLSITGGKLVNDEDGAAIRTAAPLLIEHSTVWGNEAVGSPGILVMSIPDTRTVTLHNSTVSGNVSTGYTFGAIRSWGGRVVLDGSTVAHNSHMGIFAYGNGSAVLRNSIVADNGIANCGYYVGREGVSLSDDESCGDSTNFLIGDAKLGPLANNGGPGMTHALGPMSAALNAAGTGCGPVDQRYAARDLDCDLGAYESADPKTLAVAIDPSADVVPVSGYVHVGGTAQCARATQFGLSVQLKQKGVQGTEVVQYVPCGPTAQRWDVQIIPTGGAFKKGPADVTVTTQGAQRWVTPGTTSRSIKLRV